MNKLLFLLVLLVPYSTYCQKHFTLSGKIVDAETKTPLPFATIQLGSTTMGTISNQFGDFDLIFSDHDSIVISTLGYQSSTFELQSALDSGKKVFELSPEPILLDEVIVSEKKTQLEGEAILRLALKHQKANFPDEDYNLSLFFRETNRLNDKYFKLVEAAATVTGKKYPNTSKRVYIDEIRAAVDSKVSVPIATEMQSYNPFREFQSLIGRISKARACKDCDYHVEEYFNHQGGLGAVITSTDKNAEYPRVFRYHIDLESYAVMRMEFESSIPYGMAFNATYEDYQSSLTFLKRTFDYQNHDGRYFLGRYYQEATHQYKPNNSDEKGYLSTHALHVITNEVTVGLANSTEKEDLMNYKDKISEKRKKYNPDFWASYNVLKQTPLDEKIIEDLSNGKNKEKLFNQEN